MTQNPCAAVRSTCDAVMRHAKHVSIRQEGVSKAAAELAAKGADCFVTPVEFDFDIHLSTTPQLTVQYLLLVDTLNFCFWSDEELQYEHLARGLKEKAIADPSILTASKLAKVQGHEIQEWLGWKRPLPQQEERARLVREVGEVLLEQYQGSAANLVLLANKSAAKLVELVTAHFPGFRDHAIHNGQQVFFYKRAQIFVGDVYGAFQGQGLGDFTDIEQLTMFPDYRVPVVLRNLGVLEYTDSLTNKIHEGEEIMAGSTEELEIRAASVVAVEQIKASLEQTLGTSVKSVLIDWSLWHMGEKYRSEQKHHKTWTIYY